MILKKQFKATKPDPRILIIQIIIISVLSFSFTNWTGILLLFIVMDILVWIFLNLRTSIGFLSFYAFTFILQQLLQKVHIPVISFVFPMFLMVVIRVTPIYMASVILVRKTLMNELMVALRKLHISMIILIPIAVIYRYIPTLRMDITYVHESLSMRDLNSSIGKILKNPMKSIEYFLIPLLFRSEKITEELCAATLCKGLSVNRERTCCTDVKLEAEDYLYLIMLLIIGFSLSYVNAHINIIRR